MELESGFNIDIFLLFSFFDPAHTALITSAGNKSHFTLFD